MRSGCCRKYATKGENADQHKIAGNERRNRRVANLRAGIGVAVSDELGVVGWFLGQKAWNMARNAAKGRKNENI